MILACLGTIPSTSRLTLKHPSPPEAYINSSDVEITFGFKTIYASFMLSLVMDFMEKALHSYALTTNMLLAIMLGTIIIATGLGIAFAINASTGGTDILAKILNKYTTFNIGISLLIVDLFVVVCGGLTFGLDKGIYSLLAVIANGLIVDAVIAKIDKVKSNKIESQSQAKHIA